MYVCVTLQGTWSIDACVCLRTAVGGHVNIHELWCVGVKIWQVLFNMRVELKFGRSVAIESPFTNSKRTHVRHSCTCVIPVARQMRRPAQSRRVLLYFTPTGPPEVPLFLGSRTPLSLYSWNSPRNTLVKLVKLWKSIKIGQLRNQKSLFLSCPIFTV